MQQGVNAKPFPIVFFLGWIAYIYNNPCTMKRSWLWLLCIPLFSCAPGSGQKINGVSFVASREEAVSGHVQELLGAHVTHAALMPYAFLPSDEAPTLVFDGERQWFGETARGVSQYVEQLHAKGIKVMVKPQIWIRHGTFTGSFVPSTEAGWEQLETSYEAYILRFAHLAQKEKVDLFCIGTELETFIAHRPEFWEQLITKVRKAYSGPLTYAANWDEYQKVPFWKSLDFIGVDAYFPLSDKAHPSVADLQKGWEPWKKELSDYSQKEDRPILFTEFGYRSICHVADRPWTVERDAHEVDLQGQADALQVLFDTFWNETWFAGGYLWKWFPNSDRITAQDDSFSPQNKPAEKVVRDFYGSH